MSFCAFEPESLSVSTETVQRYLFESPPRTVVEPRAKINIQTMKEADKGFFRGMSIVGSIAIMCIMLILSAILKPAKRAWSSSSSNNQPTPRGLEIGDPERERRRHGAGKRDRGMPNPDEYDIFGNPWNGKGSSLDSGSGDFMRGLDARDAELPHPDAFNIASEDGANPFAKPTPETVFPVSPGLISLGTISTFALDIDNDEEETGNTGSTTAAPDSSAPSTAAPSPEVAPEKPSPTPTFSSSSSSPSSFTDSLPHWLVARKATAGPRVPRFVEVDVDGPTIAPPDLDLIAKQQELLERAPIGSRPSISRGDTWHPGQDSGEEPPRPAVARNSTSRV